MYIVASIAFMAGFEGIRPDRWDMIGAGLALAGAAIVFFGPRAV
ncbi:YnfA family protein [Devosia rhizoryzae]|uniref:Uncharacterized protein n=1 Tax=Devosia rhizoryzae TaxID=2774137 RepID=A0ABX7C9U5_9HYPH|nr:hypothetical protein [Devosia rhizoryzae]QQR41060.1 hypothetical protein JI748_00825 [Devosia rhizoryzae]